MRSSPCASRLRASCTMLLGLLRLAHDGLALLVVERARLGQADAARVAVEQPHLQPRLGGGDLLGHRGLGGVELARGLGEAAGLHHAHEHLHGQQSVHAADARPVIPPWNSRYGRGAAFCHGARLPTVEATSTRRLDMAKMTAAQAAVLVMEKEGVTQAFGVPGAAINPLYSALRKQGTHRAHPGAPRRRRLAHGRGLHPRRRRQHRRVHRHLGAGRHRHDHRACTRPGPIRFPSSASPARRRARGCTRKTSRRSTSSRSPSRSPSGRSRCASPARCRRCSSRPST